MMKRSAPRSITKSMANLYLYLSVLPVLLIVDFLWIGVVAQKFYRAELGDLFAPTVNWVAAVVFYLLYAAAIVFFVVAPALERQSLVYALLAGLFLGLVAYATYDLTNLAVIRNWPLMMSIVDMAWGAVMTGAVSAAVYFIATAFLGR